MEDKSAALTRAFLQYAEGQPLVQIQEAEHNIDQTQRAAGMSPAEHQRCQGNPLAINGNA